MPIATHPCAQMLAGMGWSVFFFFIPRVRYCRAMTQETPTRCGPVLALRFVHIRGIDSTLTVSECFIGHILCSFMGSVSLGPLQGSGVSLLLLLVSEEKWPQVGARDR